MPAPYLLVARMPPVPSSNPTPADRSDLEDPSSAEAEAEADKSSKGSKSKNSKDNKKDDDEGSSSAPAGGAPSTNTSFLASTPQYMLKLVYLPDKTQPMAMSVRTGLFGAASMKPSLQDGWMLTSLDASADSKTAETLTAIASLVSASTTGVAGGAAKGGTEAAKNLPGGKNVIGYIPDFSDQILRPGLYKFVYDKRSGELKGLHRVTSFEATGVDPDVPDESDVSTGAGYARRNGGKW